MFTGKLYDFQVEAKDFLLEKGNALCAYQMGLGKTALYIAAIEEVEAFPTLLICPNYLKFKHLGEINKWCNSPVMVIDGTKKKRLEQYDSFETGYMVINYELILQDWLELQRFRFMNITCDEITRIKSYKSKTKKAIKKLRTSSRWGLTGTPISNKPDELYSIMDWIQPGHLGKWPFFEENYIERGFFGQVERYKNLQDLARISGKRMISKRQEDVSEELPEVVYENVPLEFTNKQKKLYVEIAASLKNYLDKYVSDLLEDNDDDYTTALIRQRFSALRQATISPMLLDLSETKYVASLQNNFQDLGAKIPAVLSLIEEASHKVVVFCFFRGVIEYLVEELTKQGVSYRMILGGLGAEEVYKRAKEFQETDAKVFLSTDAGNMGLDLQAAKYLINIDVPLSNEVYSQRCGRIKRLGSKHDAVFIYNLYMRGSYEERLLTTLDAKVRLSDAIMGYNDLDFVIPSEISLREFLGENL